MADAPAGQAGPEDASQTPLLEWIAAAIGAVLFAAALFVLGREALLPDAEPFIEAEVIESLKQRRGWLLVIEARNEGDKPAENVFLAVTLGPGAGKREETRAVLIDFIGPRSVRRAGVFVEGDPAGREVRIEPQGYLRP